eukprot:scpid108278/ scgid22399/ 
MATHMHKRCWTSRLLPYCIKSDQMLLNAFLRMNMSTQPQPQLDMSTFRHPLAARERGEHKPVLTLPLKNTLHWCCMTHSTRRLNVPFESLRHDRVQYCRAP